MAKRFLTSIDLTKKPLLNLVHEQFAIDPINGISGQSYYNTVSKKVRIFNGLTWDELGGGGGSTDISGLVVKASNLADLTNITTARSNLGLGNVDNTSDLNKPIATLTQTALDLKTSKILTVSNSLLTPARYRTDGTGDQVQIQNAIDDVVDAGNENFGAKILVVSPTNLQHNPIYVEVIGSFQRRLAIRLRSNIDIEFVGKITFPSGGTSGGTFTTAMGNWGDLSDFSVKVNSCDGLSTTTGIDSDEHGLIWLDAQSQTLSKVERGFVDVKYAFQMATAVGRFRGGSGNALKYVQAITYNLWNSLNVDATITTSLDADVMGYILRAKNTYAEGVLADGCRTFRYDRIDIDTSTETGLRIGDNFSGLTVKEVYIGYARIRHAEKHGVLLSGIEKGFLNLDVGQSGKNTLRITTENVANNIPKNLVIKLIADQSNTLLNADATEGAHLYLNKLQDSTIEVILRDTAATVTTLRPVQFDGACTNVFVKGVAKNLEYTSSSPVFNLNTQVNCSADLEGGFVSTKLGFLTVTTVNPTINLKTGESQKIIFNQNITFDNTNPLQSDLNRGQTLDLIFEQGATGATPGLYTVTIDATSNIKLKANFVCQTGVGVLTVIRLMFISSTAGWIEVGRVSERQVYTTEAQTLTNKTINFASNTVNDTTNKRLLTDAQVAIVGATSGSNTGDETKSTIATKLATSLGSIYMNQLGGASPAGTALTTLSATADTFVGLVGTAIAGATLVDFTVATGSTSTIPRITFTNATTKRFLVNCTYSAATSEATGFYSFSLSKTGVRYVETRAVNRGSANDFAGSITAIVSLAQNDYIELWGANSLGAASTVRLKALGITVTEIY